MSANFCESCGNPLSAGARFCASCGRPVAPALPASPAPLTPAPATPSFETPPPAGTPWRTLVPWIAAGLAVPVVVGWLAYRQWNQFIEGEVRNRDDRYERVCAPEIQAFMAQASDDSDRELLDTLKDGAWLIASITDTSLDEQLKEVAKENADDEQYFLLKACATVYGHGLQQKWDEPTQMAKWKEVRPTLALPAVVPPPESPDGPPALTSFPPAPPPLPARKDAKDEEETTPPRVSKKVPPVYPPIAQAARVQGLVILEAAVTADGTVTEVKVVRSIPLLDQAALDAVKQWQFEPASRGGVAVPGVATVTVQFTLQ
jgi:TonB family protein